METLIFEYGKGSEPFWHECIVAPAANLGKSGKCPAVHPAGSIFAMNVSAIMTAIAPTV
jgi:hypothetical protein